MKKIFIGALFTMSFLLSYVCVSAAISTNYVSTANPTNIEHNKATLVGTTASSSSAGSTVHVYFEYGTSYSTLSSSTPPQLLSSGESVAGNELRKFSVVVNDLSPRTRTYFRIVRKITPSTGAAVFHKSTIKSFDTPVLNLPPYIQSLVTTNSQYVSSDCGPTACTIEVPENLPSRHTIARLKKADPNGDSVTLSFKSGNTDSAFELSTSGDLLVSKKSALDFETNPEFTLVIEVKDGGVGRLTSTYTLKIKLKNIVDESLPLPPRYVSTTTAQVPSYVYNPNRNVNYVSTNQINNNPYTYRPNINTTEYKSTNSVDIEPYVSSTNNSVRYTSSNNSNITPYVASNRGNNTNNYVNNNSGANSNLTNAQKDSK